MEDPTKEQSDAVAADQRTSNEEHHKPSRELRLSEPNTDNPSKHVQKQKLTSAGMEPIRKLESDTALATTGVDIVTKLAAPARLSVNDSLCFAACTVCQQLFPFPLNLPENHPVVSQQSDDYLSVQEGQGRMASLKSRNGNLFTGDATTKTETKHRAGCIVDETNRDTQMADDIPMFPKARSMFIHSGNIINWNRLKRKPNQISSEEPKALVSPEIASMVAVCFQGYHMEAEQGLVNYVSQTLMQTASYEFIAAVCDVIGKTLGAFLETEDKTQLQYVTEIYKINSENIQKLEENEREEVKITVKLFICMPQPASVISESVNKVLNELGTNFVETLLLAVSPSSRDDEDDPAAATLETLQPYWEAMEELVSEDKVLSLGICDLSKDEFEGLYNWAKVKPSIDQVNLQSCCVMPQDLTEYAKSVNVQLLTHNDIPVLISNEALQETIRSASTEPDSADWIPQWVVRYSGILKCRGIIKMKGYIFHTQRGNKKLLL